MAYVTNEYSQNYTTVVTGQPQIVTFQPRDWNHSLCGCFDDCGEFCYAYFCTCCYACDLASRLGEPCWSICYGGFVPMRTMIRTQRKIEGNICNDFCAVTCCPFCALVQMGKEVKETAPLV